MKIDGAIFDLDGTLLDSMFIWDTLGRDYLISMGKTPKPDIIETLRPLSMDQVTQLFIDEYGVEQTAGEIKAGVNKTVEKYYFESIGLKAGAHKFLEYLSRRGVKMCVATASDRYVVEAALRRNGIDRYFSRIYTCSEVGYAKNRPDIFRAALSWLGTQKSRTWVFEDIYLAMKTAHDDGFPVIAIYDKTSENHAAEIEKTARLYVRSFDEIGSFLE